MSTPDDDLITLARNGHRPAFEMLVQRTLRLVWAHEVLHTRDRTLADDLVQETYLRAWKSISKLNEPGAFRGWLLKIADNVRLDSIKQTGRRKRGTPDRLVDQSGQTIDPQSSDPNPHDQAEKNDLANRALEAIRQLPEQYQQAIALRYLGGADYNEISKQLALSNGSLRGLLHRGMELLREKLNVDQEA